MENNYDQDGSVGRCVRSMSAALLFLIVGVCFPADFDFPFLAKPMTGRTESIETVSLGRGYQLRMKISDRERPLTYDCNRGRHGSSCLPFNSLRDFASTDQPRNVSYIAYGDELLMLSSGDWKIIRFWAEQMRRVWFPLAAPILAVLVAATAIWRLHKDNSRLSEAAA